MAHNNGHFGSSSLKQTSTASDILAVIAFIAIFAMIFALSPSHATAQAKQTTWYVATSGSDKNPGTKSAPFATIAHADTVAQPGDTVLVASGTYKGAFSTPYGGTSAAPITFKCATPGGAILQGNPGDYSVWNVAPDSNSARKSNFIVIDGFTVTSLNHTSNGGNGIDIAHSNHITVQNCTCFHNEGSGIQSNWSDYITLIGNVCYANANLNGYQCSGISLYEQQAADSKPGFHNYVIGNISCNNIETFPGGYHTDGNGIIIDDFHNSQQAGNKINYAYKTLVENNLCYGNGGKGIEVYVSDNVSVLNNTCYWNNRDTNMTGNTWFGEICVSFATNCTVANNIAVTNPSYNSGNAAIMLGSDSTFDDSKTTFANNLTFNGKNGDASVHTDGSKITVTAANGNQLGFNPLFNSPTIGSILTFPSTNFQLQSLSPAVRAGTVGGGSTAAPNDILGTSRPSGVNVDLGCYGFQGTFTYPVPTLTSLTPDTTPAGSTGVTLTLNGTGFVRNSKVQWNGNALTTTYVSASQLTATIPDKALAIPGTASVTVHSPTPGGGTSAPRTFTIRSNGTSMRYDFETGAEGWFSNGGYIASIAQSSAAAFTGTHSLAVHMAGATTGVAELAVSSPGITAGKTVTVQIWVPANSSFDWIQLFAQDANYNWIGNTLSTPIPGIWNAINLVIPSNAAMPIGTLGIQFDRTRAFTGACFIDSITW